MRSVAILILNSYRLFMVIYFKDNKNQKWLPAFDQKKDRS